MSHERRRRPHPADPGGGGQLHPAPDRWTRPGRTRTAGRGAGGRRRAAGGPAMSWRWGPHTLRARLTLWYMAVMVAVLGVYVSAVLVLVARNLSDALDARLRSDFRWAAEMAEQGPGRLAVVVRGGAVDGGPVAAGLEPRGRAHLSDVGRGAAAGAHERGPRGRGGRPHPLAAGRSGAVPPLGRPRHRRRPAGGHPGRPFRGVHAARGPRARGPPAAGAAPDGGGGRRRRLSTGAGGPLPPAPHGRAGARHHRRESRRAAAHRQPARRAGPARGGVQRHPRPASSRRSGRCGSSPPTCRTGCGRR